MTNFSQKVLEIVSEIPKGQTLTYKEVARLAGLRLRGRSDSRSKPLAYRAVGQILSKNRDPDIPCHRVIRSDGKPGEYNRGKTRKLSLLNSEGVIFDEKQR